MTNQELANKIIDRILKNLEESTWADQRPRAMKELAEYRKDLVEDVLFELVACRDDETIF